MHVKKRCRVAISVDLGEWVAFEVGHSSFDLPQIGKVIFWLSWC